MIVRLRLPAVEILSLALLLVASIDVAAPGGPDSPGSLESPEGAASSQGVVGEDAPEVMVAILARNTAHTLPNFLGYLESLDYPKHRMSIWIRTDHNEDATLSMLREWSNKVRPLYSNVDLGHEEAWLFADRNPLLMTDARYEHISKLRQEGLAQARKSGVRYMLWLDCDAFLVNNQTLRLLVEQQKPVVTPVLGSGGGQAYSNFWCGQNEQGYYKRTPEYLPILSREKVGCFKVPVVYTAVLVDLQNPNSRGLRFWPITEGFNGPVDDVVHFAYSAKNEGLDFFVLNTEFFGYVVKTQRYQDMADAANKFLTFKLKTLVNHPPVLRSQYITTDSSKDKADLDQIFMISLERRPERRNRMLACLEELQLDFTLFDAVDGRKLNQTYLDELGISYMPGWKDPWGERPMTFGEVGCFLSHYSIWEKVLKKGMDRVLVLEDDIDFEPNFRESLRLVLNEAQVHTPLWDLIYVGRKILDWENEKLVIGTQHLVVPHYSYWTLGYIISNRGARKLLEARPFQNLLPVDEYLPIMFGTHPEKGWVAHFPTRNLEAYSANPLLVNPTHYVGDQGWFSDTEPPVEVLEKIRQRKVKEEKEEQEKARKMQTHQEKVRQAAEKRQIEAMRQKLKPKAEL